MHMMDRCIAKGQSMAVAVTDASLQRVAKDAYNSAEIRLEAALLLDTYAGQTNTRLQRLTAREPRQGMNKKRRIRSKKDHSRESAVVVDLS